MKNSRRKFSPEFNFKVVLEALKERETLVQLAVRFEVHPNMISNRKRDFVENPARFFEGEGPKNHENADSTALYAKIGRLEMANDF